MKVWVLLPGFTMWITAAISNAAKVALAHIGFFPGLRMQGRHSIMVDFVPMQGWLFFELDGGPITFSYLKKSSCSDSGWSLMLKNGKKAWGYLSIRDLKAPKTKQLLIKETFVVENSDSPVNVLHIIEITLMILYFWDLFYN